MKSKGAALLFLAWVGVMGGTRVLLAKTVTPLKDGWQLASACQMQSEGAEVSSATFHPDTAASGKSAGWLPVAVPSTVLAAQVANKVFPDPYFGDNLRHLPGMGYPVGANFSLQAMPEDSPYRCGWWYRTTFPSPSLKAGERGWLHFAGINYRADVWLNGKKIADKSAIAGAYRTYDLDATDALRAGANNVLAVEVWAPTEQDLGINWVDWNPAPPDKDMGLWGAVDLEQRGPVAVRSPMAQTHWTDNSLHTAELTVYAELHNSLPHPVKGVVSGTAAGARFSMPVELAANEDRTVSFTPGNAPGLRFTDPQPWWPYQMGDPHLETLTVTFRPDGNVGPADEAEVRFGFREVRSELTANGARLFRVNGKPLLIRGAGWSPDMLLRPDTERLAYQLRMVRDMHLNTIRLEGKLETPEFFAMADEQGILVMLGWCCCDMWERWEKWQPEQMQVATASLHDQMLRLRHHASLLVWLNGSDNAPPANVEKAYLDVEAATHWPNPTLASASATDTAGAGPSGVKMTGPYDYVAPSYWYVDQTHGGAWGFNTETSPGPAIPSLASREKFLADPQAWPPTADWNLHNGGGEFGTLAVFDSAMAAVYAKPTSAAAYERMAQTMAFDSERAMFEAYSKNKYSTGGVIQWMLNNAWPSMIWHLYDYYLEAGAGYFATKKACEPLHIQYSYDTGGVVVVNSTYGSNAATLHASAEVRNITWQSLWKGDGELQSAPDSAQEVLHLPERLFIGSDRILLVDLRLTDTAGKLVSRNFYWVPTTLTSFDFTQTDFTHTPALRHEDLQAMTQLPPARVRATATVVREKQERVVAVELENTSGALAFQVHADMRTPEGGLVAPVFWSDNWIELAPGEKQTLTAEVPAAITGELHVQVAGWNVQETKLRPAAAASTASLAGAAR
jgi:exo-1,4-beta-D-glucosaminidase